MQKTSAEYQGIYEWAGQYRTVDVSKNGFTWLPAARVEQNMEALRFGVSDVEVRLEERLHTQITPHSALQTASPFPFRALVGYHSGRQANFVFNLYLKRQEKRQ